MVSISVVRQVPQGVDRDRTKEVTVKVVETVCPSCGLVSKIIFDPDDLSRYDTEIRRRRCATCPETLEESLLNAIFGTEN